MINITKMLLVTKLFYKLKMIIMQSQVQLWRNSINLL